MCGTTYANSFEDRLAIAQDEDRCHELLSQLRDDLTATDKMIEGTNELFTKAKTEFARVTEILNMKRGKLQLKDLIESEGKKEVQRIIRGDIAEVERQIAEVEGQIAGVKVEMERYDDAQRRKSITKRFRELMRDFLSDVEVHTLNHNKLFVYSIISETGSDLPRRFWPTTTASYIS